MHTYMNAGTRRLLLRVNALRDGYARSSDQGAALPARDFAGFIAER